MGELEKVTALVTGASSGIGRAICERLLSHGIQVYGIGRSFDESKAFDNSEGMHEIVCDLLDTNKLIDTISDIKKEASIDILVNCAGVGYYGLHEELNPDKIIRMVRTNLEAPMIITNMLLRDLKEVRGTIVNISSVTAIESNPHGCAYGATKAGLSSFSNSLFDEARKYGVKVVTIQPDMTDTNLYRNADFTVDKDTDAYLTPEEVANAVDFAINQRDGMVVNTITLKPQKKKIARKSNVNNNISSKINL